MATHISGGVKIDGQHPRTKTSLKAALKDAPETVTFYGTSNFGSQFEGPISDLPPGDVILDIAGPDPYTDRRWYATVIRHRLKGIQIS